MTRIGFAYNQKPDVVGLVSAKATEPRAEEEPPSIGDAYAEWDSAQTIDAVAAALSVRDEQPDIVFNMAEGLRGPNRESHVPAICEFLDLPYSGSDPFTLSLCLNKARTKDALAAHGIASAPFLLIESVAGLDALLGGASRGSRRASPLVPLTPSHFPLFLKPVQEGSSKGITERNLVRSRDELEDTARFLLST